AGHGRGVEVVLGAVGGERDGGARTFVLELHQGVEGDVDARVTDAELFGVGAQLDLQALLRVAVRVGVVVGRGDLHVVGMAVRAHHGTTDDGDVLGVVERGCALRAGDL